MNLIIGLGFTIPGKNPGATVLRFKTITPDLRPKKLKIKVLTEPSYYVFLLHGRAIVIVYDVGRDR